MKLHTVVMLAGLSLAAVTAGTARAASLPAPGTIINTVADCTTTASAPCAESYGFAPNTGMNDTTITDGPTSYTLGDTFNEPTSTQTAADFGASVYTGGLGSNSPRCPAGPNCLDSSPLLTWNFQDNYEFTTPSSAPAAQGAVLSFTVPNYGGSGGVGLASLEARIIAYNAAASSATQLVGTNQITIVDGWTGFSQQAGALELYTATLDSTQLSADTEYVLQIRGEALSAAGYTGTVTFTPVPLPTPMTLLLSGLGTLLALALGRQRRSRPNWRINAA